MDGELSRAPVNTKGALDSCHPREARTKGVGGPNLTEKWTEHWLRARLCLLREVTQLLCASFSPSVRGG